MIAGQDCGRNLLLMLLDRPRNKDSGRMEVQCCGRSWDQCLRLELVLGFWTRNTLMLIICMSLTYTCQWKSPPLSLQLQSSSKVHIGKNEEQAESDSSEKSPQSSVPSHTVTWSVHTPKNRRFQTQSNFTAKPSQSLSYHCHM